MSQHNIPSAIKDRLFTQPNNAKAFSHLSKIIDYSFAHSNEDPVKTFEENSIIIKKTEAKDSKPVPPNEKLLKWINDNITIHEVSLSARLPKPSKLNLDMPPIYSMILQCSLGLELHYLNAR